MQLPPRPQPCHQQRIIGPLCQSYWGWETLVNTKLCLPSLQTCLHQSYGSDGSSTVVHSPSWRWKIIWWREKKWHDWGYQVPGAELTWARSVSFQTRSVKHHSLAHILCPVWPASQRMSSSVHGPSHRSRWIAPGKGGSVWIFVILSHHVMCSMLKVSCSQKIVLV